MRTLHAGRLALAASVLFLGAEYVGSAAAQPSGGKPETVTVTCHAKPGSEGTGRLGRSRSYPRQRD
jgi:hypothetical protein